MAVALYGDVTPNGMNQGDIYAVLANLVTIVAELKLDHDAIVTDYTAGRAEIAKLVTDYAAGRAEIVKLVTDVANLISSHNTLATKLNNDGGVTDTNYAAASAATAANPAAATAAAPAAVSSTTIAATTPTLTRS